MTESIARRVSMPVFGHLEDIMRGILIPFFQGQNVYVATVFEDGLPLPCVVARQERRSGAATHFVSDNRFLMPALLSVDTLTTGLDADQDGADLQEAVRIAIHEAWHHQTIIPGAGYIARIENSTKPSRVSDWATSSGPVQYASLPKHVLRYESNYRLLMRPDQDQTHVTNPFVRQVIPPNPPLN